MSPHFMPLLGAGVGGAGVHHAPGLPSRPLVLLGLFTCSPTRIGCWHPIAPIAFRGGGDLPHPLFRTFPQRPHAPVRASLASRSPCPPQVLALRLFRMPQARSNLSTGPACQCARRRACSADARLAQAGILGRGGQPHQVHPQQSLAIPASPGGCGCVWVGVPACVVGHCCSQGRLSLPALRHRPSRSTATPEGAAGGTGRPTEGLWPNPFTHHMCEAPQSLWPVWLCIPQSPSSDMTWLSPARTGEKRIIDR